MSEIICSDENGRKPTADALAGVPLAEALARAVEVRAHPLVAVASAFGMALAGLIGWCVGELLFGEPWLGALIGAMHGIVLWWLLSTLAITGLRMLGQITLHQARLAERAAEAQD